MKGFILSLLVYHLALAEGRRSFDVLFHNIAYKLISPKIEEYAISLTKHEGIPVLGGYVLFKELVEEISFRATIDVIRSNNKMYRIIDVTVDLCEALKQSKKGKFAVLVYHEVKKFGRLPETCPIPAHTNYSVQHFNLSPEQFPPYTPEMTFIVNMSWYFDKEFAGTGNVIGRIKSKKRNSFAGNTKTKN